MQIVFKCTPEQLEKNILTDLPELGEKRVKTLVFELFDLVEHPESIVDAAWVLDTLAGHYLFFGNYNTTYLWNDHVYVGKPNPVINFWLGGREKYGSSLFKMHYNTITDVLTVG